MAKRQTYVVLGLGRFGFTLAKKLSDYNQDVIAIDKDLALVEKASPFVANAFCLDYSDIDALKSAGVKDADVGIVTTGSMLDQEIQGILNLKELGIQLVLAKATDHKASVLLKKVGADETISPEHDTAVRCAKKLISKDILDLFDIDSDNIMFEMKVQSNWVNHSLIELNLRNRFSLNVVGVKRNDKLNVNINPEDKFKEDDIVLLVAHNSIFDNFNELNSI